ncbi:MAG: hypothetical protein PHE65_02185, partial [Candidatus Omnitrophica bacterium]|nr:hypothetical protein [Candidatus Omnitrophota bacterium]
LDNNIPPIAYVPRPVLLLRDWLSWASEGALRSGAKPAEPNNAQQKEDRRADAENISKKVFQAAFDLTGDAAYLDYKLKITDDKGTLSDGRYSTPGGKPTVRVNIDNMTDQEIAKTIGHEIAHGLLMGHKIRPNGLLVSIGACLISLYAANSVLDFVVPSYATWVALIPALYIGLFPKRMDEAKCELIGNLLAYQAGLISKEDMKKAPATSFLTRALYMAIFPFFTVFLFTHPTETQEAKNRQALADLLEARPGIDLKKIIQGIKDLNPINMVFFKRWTRKFPDPIGISDMHNDGVDLTPQIGKRSKIKQVRSVAKSDTVELDVVDTKTGRQKNVSITTYSSKYGGGDFSTGTSVNSECREVVEEIAAKNSSAGASIVKSLFDMIPDTVLVRSYDMMVGDILGFSSPEHDLIALNALIEEHPLSLFHEMAEYLVRAGLVSIRNTGGSLIILNKQGERIGQIELRNAAARQLAARAQGDPHYLIRAFQQEVFKDIDTDLTARIEMILLARDRLEKALGMIEAADPKLVSQLLSEADLDMETFIARILDNLLTGADNISYARGTRMLEFAASVLNVVMAEMETDVDPRKKLGILCGILFSIQTHDI